VFDGRENRKLIALRYLIVPNLCASFVFLTSLQNELIEIGFVFKAGKTPQWTTTERKTWDERYQELLAFKEEHGHTLVSQKSGSALGVWVKEQRTGYRKMKQGEKTHMTAEKALMLKEIGFHFDATMFKGPNGALKDIASTF
jgi:hypothetical protein